MLKRIWVVVSVLWTAWWFVVYVFFGAFNAFGDPTMMGWALLPWLAGGLIWITWRLTASFSTSIRRY